MPNLDRRHEPNPSPGVALGSALRAWLLAGAVLCLVFPPLRGSSYWLGWLPLWLVVTPLIGLAIAREPWHEARALARVLFGMPAVAPVQARRRRPAR